MAQITVSVESVVEPNAAEKQLFSDMRSLALRQFPYFANVAFRLPMRCAPGLGTGVITQAGLIIYDPHVLEIWGPKNSAAHLAHLWMHWVFEHYRRSLDKIDVENVVYQDVWNVASDCSVALNFTGSATVKLVLPPDIPCLSYFPGVEGDTVESIYDSLLEHLIADKYGSADSGEGDNDEGGEGSGSGDGELTVEDILNAGGGYCGSGAGNKPLSNEPELEADINASANDSTVADWEQSAIRKATAESMKEHALNKGIGTLPGEMMRWVEEFLAPPAVDWRTKLRTSIKDPLIRRAGVIDYTWTKLPRHKRTDGIITPRTQGAAPSKVGVFVDTSGSMSETDLGIALNEVRHILSDYQVFGYAVDVGVHFVGPILNTSSFKLLGGGGTDMSNAIYRAVEDKLDMAVVLTDGETPWPLTNPHPNPAKFNVVAGIITHLDEDSHLFTSMPKWIDSAHIPANPHGR